METRFCGGVRAGQPQTPRIHCQFFSDPFQGHIRVDAETPHDIQLTHHTIQQQPIRKVSVLETPGVGC
jgi:hypothetical protein